MTKLGLFGTSTLAPSGKLQNGTQTLRSLHYATNHSERFVILQTRARLAFKSILCRPIEVDLFGTCTSASRGQLLNGTLVNYRSEQNSFRRRRASRAERSQNTADDGDGGGGELLLRPPNARARDITTINELICARDRSRVAKLQGIGREESTLHFGPDSSHPWSVTNSALHFRATTRRPTH